MLALAVVAALGLALPAQHTDASDLQQLTVRTTGIPAGTEVGLFRLDSTGTRLGWQESASTDATGAVTFATVPGQTYTLWAAETATTFPQYLGGAASLDAAARFTTPDAATSEQAFAVAPAPLVTGAVTWPDQGTTAYGEVNLHTWDAAAKTWALASYAPITDLTATGGTFTAKAPAGVAVALSAFVERADRSTASGWLGSGTTAPASLAAATTVTATEQSPVTGVALALVDVAPSPEPGPSPEPSPSGPQSPSPSPTTPASTTPAPTPAPPVTAPPRSTTNTPTNDAPARPPATEPRTVPPVAAKISGKPRVGARLTATAAPRGWTASYTWKRDGRAIARANARAYRPTTSDAGRRLSVTVSLRKTGYAPAASTSKAVRVAKVASKVRVAAAKRAVRVTVKAKGVAKPTGKVTVKVGKTSRTYTLKARHRGVLTVKAPAGRAKVRVTYQGDARVAKGTTTKTVRVR
ncbi:hypothetical protein ATL41_1776 [Flavimobilis soli]|uniref:Ig-like domain-containing protein n=1 Tax=Flavimobilis soli TaxID=442709 RepID=A0A2A9EFI9_9MICO|nr:hypothetical protein ATL41_1776 [Flavimobilis soli]